MSELQSALTGAIGHRLHAAVISIPSAVEDNPRDTRVLCLCGEPLADLGGPLRLLAIRDALIRDSQKRALRAVVDELCVNVLDRAVDDEPRPLRGAIDPLPNAEMALVALFGARLRLVNWSHYFAPALPALRRICSPTYLIPFPLYGSGGRKLRSSAATCPTSSLSAPSTTTCVGCGAVNLIPFGALYSTGCENP